MGNIRAFGANPLTLTPVTCLNRASGAGAPVVPIAMPLRVEGAGFLLTYSGQSAINVFTALVSMAILYLYLSSTDDNKITIMCRR
jgi:hypothetical protein